MIISEKQINTDILKKEIKACGWSDLTWFNGSFNKGTPEYSPDEIIELADRKNELQNQLDYIEGIEL